mmetsp:Transcript_23222/g.35392  ORF Transcript_23222/g.35392 Transcript_23222/m.35392 type:complete len:339 (+) Transcript_23222:234-1250(+)
MVAIIVLEDSAARAVSTGLVLGAVEAEGAAAFFRKPVGTGTVRGAGAVADVAAAVAAVLVVVAPPLTLTLTLAPMTCAAACAAAVVAAIGSGTELPAEAAAAAVATANATGEGAVVVFEVVVAGVVVAGAVVVVVATDRFLLLAASESATSARRSMLSDLILAFTSFFFFLAGVSEAGDGAAGDDDDDDVDDEGAFRLLPPVMKAPSTPARASADSSIGDLDVDVTADDAVGMVSIIWCSIIFASVSKFIERSREVDLANLLTRDLLLFYEEIENSLAGFSVLSCFFERELLLVFSWTTHELSQFLDGAIHRERHGFYCWVVSYTVLGGSRRCFHLGI